MQNILIIKLYVSYLLRAKKPNLYYYNFGKLPEYFTFESNGVRDAKERVMYPLFIKLQKF